MSLIENLLPDRFEVIGELGRGGTSVVYHARDSERDQEVAVKILLKDTDEDRFQREAERLSALSHPNVVTFLEVGRHEGRDFLVMEYLEMGDLNSYAKNLSVIQILRLFTQVCDGLAHLHDKGIVHRDIKPANILVGKDGRPKVTDLGVARQMERNTRLTQAGTILGTYSYLAPEQILSSTVGPRADIYSLGICLFVTLTGRKPFEADNEFNMLKAHLEAKPPSVLEYIPDAPQSLDDLVQQMLAKDEEDRPRSARAVADLLQDAIRDLENQDQEDLQPAWDEKIEELPDDQRSVLLAITYLGKDATFENVCQATPFSEDKTDRCLEALMENKLIDSPNEDSFLLSFPEETIQTRLTPRLRKLFASRLSALADSRESSQETQVEASPDPEPSDSKPDEDHTVVAAASTLAAEVAKDLKSEEPTKEEALDEDAPTVDEAAPPSLEPVPSVKKPTKRKKKSKKIAPPVEPPKAEPPPVEKPKKEDKGEEEPAKEVEALQPPPKVEFVKAETSQGKSEAKESEPKPKPTKEAKPRWALVSFIMLSLGVALTAGGFWYWAHSVTVTIVTQPEGAKVELNGHDVGVTPLTQSGLKPGLHVIDVSLEKHGLVEEKIELGFMQHQELHYTLDPLVGKLFLTLEPRDASVTIGDQVYGKINADLTLASGKHKLKVEKTGFVTYDSEIVVTEEEPLEVSVRLEPIVGEIAVTSSPKGADVTLDGNKKGKTPITLKKVSFGKHEVAVRLKGHDRFSRTVDIKDLKLLTVEAKLKELPGGLLVTSDPSGAKLKVNGEVKGTTPQTLTGLKAGSYTLTLVKDGYHAKTEKKAVEAGAETKAHFALSAIVVAPPPVSNPSPPRYNPRPPRNNPSPPRHNPRPPRNNPPPVSNPWIVE